jgi:hypothetical protein
LPRRDDDSVPSPPPSPDPPPEPPPPSSPTASIPFDLGDDAVLDDLTTRCAAGELLACDDLFVQSPSGSNYEQFGATCGGRVEEPVDGPCEEAVSL